MWNRAIDSKFRSKHEVIIEYMIEPLNEAYRVVRLVGDIHKMKEDDITRHMVRALKQQTSLAPLIERHFIDISRWAEEDCDEGVNEPDISFLITFSYLKIILEAKRFSEKRKSNALSDYLGWHGLERFLRGYYAKGEPFGGMLGYIQTGDVGVWQRKILERLEKKCSAYKCMDEITGSFISIHARANHNLITIYHMLFDFCRNEN